MRSSDPLFVNRDCPVRKDRFHVIGQPEEWGASCRYCHRRWEWLGPPFGYSALVDHWTVRELIHGCIAAAMGNPVETTLTAYSLIHA